MHQIVAQERVTLEAKIVETKEEIKRSTPVVVSTVGSLLRPSAQNELCKDAGVLTCILLDEATRTSKFEFDMLLVALRHLLHECTRLGLLGDPCQVKSVLKTLSIVASLHTSCNLGISVLHWILERFLHADPEGQDIVDRMDLLNRHQSSHRCRPWATYIINKLTPHCLPNPPRDNPTFWVQPVRGRKVWADLQAVTPETCFFFPS